MPLSSSQARLNPPLPLTRPRPAGFFQTVQRASEAYDSESQDLIVASYAQRFGPLRDYSQIMAEYKARMAIEQACLAAVQRQAHQAEGARV